ncbi:hypothetical protein CIB93_05275 [Streptomyces sp. WZ.A104]|uniref:hypothetical protein n=1 Tax=Streptomyces sp. WZ.A104 TaxID=2023771 RepID=UPI000BBB80F9|nr:hypothetical protein [Streptomyces sp. WZ.A104]PCG86955.1 hypothetical protein CIB93_05275 [Streptomyces sp. WZ.A104]
MPLTSHEAADAPPVTVEVVLLRHDPIEGFAYRRLITALGRGVSPDRAARGLALLREHDERHVVHSTSWRTTREGGIALTYLVHPDPAPGRPGLPLPEPHKIARSSKAGYPSPPDLELDHVVAHAVRHLAFLEGTDPAVAAHISAWPDLAHALHSLPLATAGEMVHA